MLARYFMSPKHSQILVNTAWMAPLGKTNISIASSTKALVMFLSLQSYYHKHADSVVVVQKSSPAYSPKKLPVAALSHHRECQCHPLTIGFAIR